MVLSRSLPCFSSNIGEISGDPYFKGDTQLVFLDLCNAFDVIDHHELLVKLKKYDFGEPEVNWVNSHLTKRQHYVVCDNDISYVQTLTSGVPQKSVLDLLSSVFISILL